MKIPTTKYLSKYVKHLFGIDVTFKIVKKTRVDGYEYSGFAEQYEYPNGKIENIIRIRKGKLKKGIPQWIIWHEVGHLLDKKGKGAIEREYNAQLFAMEQANKRGYYKVLQLIFEFTMDWKERPEKRYTESAKMLLGEK